MKKEAEWGEEEVGNKKQPEQKDPLKGERRVKSVEDQDARRGREGGREEEKGVVLGEHQKEDKGVIVN